MADNGNFTDADYQNYLLEKLFIHYIFTNDIKSDLKELAEYCYALDGDFDDDILIVYLETLINKNQELEFLDDFVKNNIKEILLLLRYHNVYTKRNDYNNIVERINNMIIKLNNSNDTNANDFYYNEVLRRNQLSYYFVSMIKHGQIELVPEEIRKELTTDFLMLVFLNMSEQDYNRGFDDKINNEYVIASLMGMLEEKPAMFLDRDFNERAKSIVENNLSYVLNYFYNHQFYKNNIKVYKKLKKIKRDK